MAKRRTAPETIRRTFTTLAPSAARQAALPGIRAVDAERRSQLAQAAKDAAPAARLQRKLASAQHRLLLQAGVDAQVLRQLAVARRQQARRIIRRLSTRSTRAQHVSAAPVAGGLGPTLLTPPYTWEWSNTWQIDYAPGVLSATADRNAGTMDFLDYPDYHSHQVDRSGGASAVGLYFQPSVDGVLTVDIPAALSYFWLYSNLHAGVNTRGWAGLIVQSFPLHPHPIGHQYGMLTHVRQQNILWDKGDHGGVQGADGSDSGDTTYDFHAKFAVTYSRWYAIWAWCGGDIHAAGESDTGFFQSWAVAKLDIHMPYAVLDLEPQ